MGFIIRRCIYLQQQHLFNQPPNEEWKRLALQLIREKLNNVLISVKHCLCAFAIRLVRHIVIEKSLKTAPPFLDINVEALFPKLIAVDQAVNRYLLVCLLGFIFLKVVQINQKERKRRKSLLTIHDIAGCAGCACADDAAQIVEPISLDLVSRIVVIGIVILLKRTLKVGQHLLDLLLTPPVLPLKNIHGEFPVSKDL